jgi:hypothetical protein
MSEWKPPKSIADLNRQNRERSEENRARFEARIEKRPGDLKAAVARLESEQMKGIGVREQSSLEDEVFKLEDHEEQVKPGIIEEAMPSIIEEARPRIISETQSRNATAKRRPRENPITDFISHKLKREPEITGNAMIAALDDDAKSGHSGAIEFDEAGNHYVVKDDNGNISHHLSRRSVSATITRLRKSLHKK